MKERIPLWKRRFTRRQVLVGTAGLGTGLVAIACGIGNETEQSRPSRPEGTPTIEPEKVAIWSNEDLEETFKRLGDSEVEEKPLKIPKETLPFYQGEIPSVYFAYYDKSATVHTIPLMYTFGGYSPVKSAVFRNIFIYGEHFPIPEGARTYDIFGRVIAETRWLRSFEDGGQEIEEAHYIPNVKSEKPARKVELSGLYFQEQDGEIIFKAKSRFSGDGFKISEDKISGDKMKDYYFMWPHATG